MYLNLLVLREQELCLLSAKVRRRNEESLREERRRNEESLREERRRNEESLREERRRNERSQLFTLLRDKGEIGDLFVSSANLKL